MDEALTQNQRVAVEAMESARRAGVPLSDNILLVGAPEPATLGLMVLGLLGTGFAGRKRPN